MATPTELADRDLLYYLKKKGLFDEETSHMFTRQIVAAVEYLHANGVVHRDLKPENVMVDCDGVLKVIDFGLSNKIEGEAMLETQCGSMCYSAPEMLCNKPYGREVDVWSIGVCLYVCVRVRARVCVRTCARVCVSACTSISASACVSQCQCQCSCVCMSMCVHVYVHGYVRTHVYLRLYLRVPSPF